MNKRTVGIIVGVVILLSVSYVVLSTMGNEDSYAGEFIRANRVYMPNNNIKLVIYFNESDTTKFVVFDDWQASHSIQLSNMESGTMIDIHYKEYILGGCKEIVGIDYL